MLHSLGLYYFNFVLYFPVLFLIFAFEFLPCHVQLLSHVLMSVGSTCGRGGLQKLHLYEDIKCLPKLVIPITVFLYALYFYKYLLVLNCFETHLLIFLLLFKYYFSSGMETTLSCSLWSPARAR